MAAKVITPTMFPDVGVDQLRQLLVYFHDFGKGTDFFQWMITQVATRENAEMKGLDGDYTTGFSGAADAFVAQIGQDGGPLRGHSQLGAFVGLTALPEATPPLLRAIIYEVIARHHGNLRNFDAGEFRGAENHEELLAEQWSRMNHTDYQAILADTDFSYEADLSSIQKDYAELFFSQVYRKLNRNKSLLPYLQTVFLFSLLLAGDKGDMMLGEREVVGRVRRMPGKLIEQYKTVRFGGGKPSLLNDWREEAYQRVAANLRNNDRAGFYAITLPTGMGKTLTAYNAAIQLQGLMAAQLSSSGQEVTPRIIYCLPFTSVIDQNAAILEDILSLSPEKLTGELAKHHYLADWPERKGESENQLEYSEKEYLVEGWEYTLTVTTFVQLLETIISNRNRQLRKFHNLANAIVILDEVQSINPQYFNLVSQLFVLLHEQLGTRFVFVTATQPFLMNPADGHDVVELTDPSRAYTARAFERMNRIDLDLRLWLEGPDDIPALTDTFAEAIRTDADRSFLIILNLVRESQEVFHALAAAEEPGVEYLYLSSAILPIRRKEIIEEIKHNRNGTRKVVISTQVVEAGVDIDLDVVYRAFAPLDSINQSAGRCNRNMDPEKRGSVRLFQNKGAKRIYSEILLDQTQAVLKEQIKIETVEAADKVVRLPEACFYAMNERYAAKIRRAIADDNDVSHKLLEDLRKLRLEKAKKEFKVIPNSYITYGAFIDDPVNLSPVMHKVVVDGKTEERQMTSTEVYQAMMDILRNDELGRWDKKQQLRLLRPALLQYVVQIPLQYFPEDLHEEAENKPFVRLGAAPGDHCYHNCYKLTTGYFKPEDTPNSQSF